jgi:membrane protease YdiL (CAAX protease family)
MAGICWSCFVCKGVGYLSELIRRYPLVAYFLIAYAGTWLVWALFVLSREGSGLLPFHSPSSFLVLISIGTFSGPTVGAFVVTAVTRGAEGVARLLRRIVRWRVGFVWYVFVLMGLPAIETIGTIAIPGALAKVTPIDVLPELISAAVFFFYPGLLGGPLGEEIGWRGFALPRLQELHGPVKASLILGLLWAFWHAPIWFSGQWSAPSLPNIAVYVFWVVAVTFIFTWVFNNTQGSVFMAILLHGTMDVFPNAFLLTHLPGAAKLTGSGVLSMYWGLALGFGLFALLLVAFTRGQLGRPR